MASITVSPEYQIILPPEIREQFNIRPGQQLEVLAYDGQLHIVPVEPVAALRGIFKGDEVPFEREKQDRLL